MEGLTASLQARLRRLDWTSAGIPVALNRPSVAVTGIGYKSEGRLLLEVRGTFASVHAPPTVYGDFIEFATLTPSDYLSIGLSERRRIGLSVTGSDKTGNAVQHPLNGVPHPPLGLLFPPLSASRSTSNGMLFLPPETYDRLQRFDSAGTGDPSYASGSFWRMMYLSAVTVTTLGFGDVTPVAESARLFVALEAVLGVVLVGVFLSRLAVGIRANR
jgi:hypothetical protein